MPGPSRRALKGSKGGYILTNRDTGKLIDIALWETEADMLAVTPAGDVIDLSEAARLLAAARAASDATTPERAALLQELRARIEDGSYEPDAEAVARELVERGEA